MFKHLEHVLRHPFSVAAHTALFHKSKGLAHLGYFAAVFLEGHGIYASLGGLLLAIGLVGFIAGDTEE